MAALNSPRRELMRIRKNYNRNADRYDSFMDHGISGRLFRRGRIGVGEAARGRVLEVGIGTGLSLVHYRPGVTLTGVDLSREMLRRARRRADGLGLKVDLLEMDAQRLALGDSSFDTVAFTLCLCTIPEPRLALREALRVVRPGGALVLLEHVRSHLWPIALVQDLINPLTVRFETDHFNRRTLALARECGMEVTRVERWALGFANLIVGRRPA